MSKSHDERAMMVLERAVAYAQEQLDATQNFKPFLMVLNESETIETIENEIEKSEENYDALCEQLKMRVKEGGVNVAVLAVDTLVPESVSKETPHSIRLHLEEKSQIGKVVGARYIYAPYTLHRVEQRVFSKLYAPIPVGIRAEYIV